MSATPHDASTETQPRPPDDPSAHARGLIEQAISETDTPRQSSPSIPQQIGPYRILEKVGEGGMGVVYKAEQRSPVQRTVALKVIRLGMDSKEVVGRFEAERQALALMSHPNVARVLDAGATDIGTPYFAMEYVPGVPITHYCEQQKLSTKEKIELFIPVCQAIQHAHQKAVIHRDLKPSNILVTLVDGKPVPKVIDFGIAKATAGRLTQYTLNTQAGSLIGTPEYMAPEQALTDGLDIDTRADVYSLGAVLYELLTGCTPFDPQQVRAAGLEGLAKLLRDTEPPRPSTRIPMSAQAAPTAQSLTRELRGDLDWVVMKCLEKDRTRRYDTANALALDLSRHLRDEPVSAGPPSAAYKVGKFVRRNRGAVLAVAAIAVLLVGGVGVSGWMAVRARQAESLAHQETEAKSKALAEQEFLRKEAEANERKTFYRAYASDMGAAQQAIAMSNFVRARALLEGYKPSRGAKWDIRGWEWRYLWQLCRSDATERLCKLPTEICSLAVSRDGRFLAVGEFLDGGLSIWDIRDRKELTPRPPAGKFHVHVAFSPRENLLAYTSGTRDALGKSHHAVHLWNPVTGEDVATAPLSEYSMGLGFTPDGNTLITSTGTTTKPGEVCAFSVPELKPIRRRSGETGNSIVGTRFAITADAVAVGKYQVRVLDAATLDERWHEDLSPMVLTAVALSPDGRTLAFATGASDSATIYLRNAVSGEPLGSPLSGHKAWIGQLVFLAGAKTLVSASPDQTIRFWDVSDPAHARAAGYLKGTANLRLAPLPDQRILVSGAEDGAIYLWDRSREMPAASDHVSFTAVTNGWSFHPQGALVTITPQGQVERRYTRDPLKPEKVMAVDGPVTGASSLNGRFMLVQTGQTLHALDVDHAKFFPAPLPITESNAYPFKCLTPDETWLAYSSRDNQFHERKLQTGAETAAWSTPGGLSALAFTPDPRRRITISGSREATLTDFTTHQSTSVNLDVPEIDDACFSPDGTLLAAAGTGVVGIGVWKTADLAGGGRVPPAFQLERFALAPHSVAFHPKESRLAAGGDRHEAVKIYDMESHLAVLTLPAEGSLFRRIGFSPDGNVLAASCDEGQLLHVWRAPSLAEIEAEEGAQGSK